MYFKKHGIGLFEFWAKSVVLGVKMSEYCIERVKESRLKYIELDSSLSKTPKNLKTFLYFSMKTTKNNLIKKQIKIQGE